MGLNGRFQRGTQTNNVSSRYCIFYIVFCASKAKFVDSQNSKIAKLVNMRPACSAKLDAKARLFLPEPAVFAVVAIRSQLRHILVTVAATTRTSWRETFIDVGAFHSAL